MSDTASTTSESKPPSSRLLEELDEHIREARAAAEEAVGYEGGPSFVDSGDVSRSDESPAESRAEEHEAGDQVTDDDQTIAPPG